MEASGFSSVSPGVITGAVRTIVPELLFSPSAHVRSLDDFTLSMSSPP